MPTAVLIFLVVVIGLLMHCNECFGKTAPKTMLEGKPINMSRVPWFLRYNAPVRDNGMVSVMPIIGLQVSTAPVAAPAGSGFAGFSPRVV